MFQDYFMHQIADLLQRDVCIFFILFGASFFFYMFASLSVRTEKQSCCQSHIFCFFLVRQKQSEVLTKKLSELPDQVLVSHVFVASNHTWQNTQLYTYKSSALPIYIVKSMTQKSRKKCSKTLEERNL